jgi:uncharacterized protein YaaW (UPF0174 family)
MEEVLDVLTPADYHFLVGLIESPFNLIDDFQLKLHLLSFEEVGTDEARQALHRQLEKSIRYLGSADIAYFARMVAGAEPGVPFREIVLDVADALKVNLTKLGTEREMVEDLVHLHVSRELAELPPEEQRRMLEDLGVEKEKAMAFVARSAGVFAVPALIQAFGTLVVDGLIKNVIFGTISRLIGSQLSGALFRLLATRFPWWLRWIGPAAWTASIGWTVVDLQGPAMRKTIPIVLYLGLCALRSRTPEPA